MSIPRRFARSDNSRAAIVKGLRKYGVSVWDIRIPGDILCWHSSFGAGTFKVLEIKTLQKNGKRRKRYDQKAQDDFLAMTSTPVVTDITQALHALGLVQNPNTSAPSTSKPGSATTSLVAGRL